MTKKAGAGIGLRTEIISIIRGSCRLGTGASSLIFAQGQKSVVPSSNHKLGVWITQDALITFNVIEKNKFQIFDLKTRKWTDFAPGVIGDDIRDARPSPDGKFLYFTTPGTDRTDPKAFRIRFSDQRVETITSLKGLNHVYYDGELNVAPDGSPIFTRDTGYQEIYALNIRWP